MNLVWPLSALFGSVLWLGVYLASCRGLTRKAALAVKAAGAGMKMADEPMLIAVAKGTNHCGAGCAPGDLMP